MATKKNTQPKKDEVEEKNPSQGATHEENGQEVSKMGVAVFPAGQHPKDRQLAAKRLAEAKDAEVVANPVVGSESVVDQLPRSTRVSKKEQAAAGAKVKGELEAAEQMEAGELEDEEEKAKKEAQEAHDKEVEEAEKDVDAADGK